MRNIFFHIFFVNAYHFFLNVSLCEDCLNATMGCRSKVSHHCLQNVMDTHSLAPRSVGQPCRSNLRRDDFEDVGAIDVEQHPIAPHLLWPNSCCFWHANAEIEERFWHPDTSTDAEITNRPLHHLHKVNAKKIRSWFDQNLVLAVPNPISAEYKKRLETGHKTDSQQRAKYHMYKKFLKKWFEENPNGVLGK